MKVDEDGWLYRRVRRGAQSVRHTKLVREVVTGLCGLYEATGLTATMQVRLDRTVLSIYDEKTRKIVTQKEVWFVH